MPNDESTPIPAADTSTGDDAEAELFYELLAEQRY